MFEFAPFVMYNFPLVNLDLIIIFAVLYWSGMWAQVLYAVLGRLLDNQNHRGRNGTGTFFKTTRPPNAFRPRLSLCLEFQVVQHKAF